MPKQCNYLGCGNNVFSHGYCQFHQWCRKDQKWLNTIAKRQNKAITGRQAIKRQSKVTHDLNALDAQLLKAICLKIWKYRLHICEECLFEFFDCNPKLIDMFMKDTWTIAGIDKDYHKEKFWIGDIPQTYFFHHVLEKGRNMFCDLRYETIGIRLKCADHHSKTTSGKITLYEGLMRKALIERFIKEGKLPDLNYDDFFKS